jgi:hypothetical protein
MSGVAVIRALLAGNTQLVAAVPAARIFGGPIPPKTTLPAIAVTQISGTERTTVSMAERQRQRTERIQVTVEAKDYPTKKIGARARARRVRHARGRRERRERDVRASRGRGPGPGRPEGGHLLADPRLHRHLAHAALRSL